MQYIAIAVPFLVLAVIIALPLKAALRGRTVRPRPARVRQPRKSTLRVVSQSQMDADLQDLIRRRP